MSDRGVKRQLSDEHVQSSPECLLPVQPSTDSDNEKSPECLFPAQPVTDGYASDEMFRSSCRLKKTNCRESNRIDFPVTPSVALQKNANGSDFKGEHSFFYEGVHYQKIGEEVLLEDKSIEECLGYLFKFSSTRFFDETKCMWNGEKLPDMKESELIDLLKWMVENDNIDWKSASPEKRSEVQNLHVQLSGILPSPKAQALKISSHIKDLYFELSSERDLQSIEERSIRHNIITRCIESIAELVCGEQYIRNGMCVHWFDLYVHDDLVTADSPLIPDGREVFIKNRPDGVFTFPYSTLENLEVERLWLVPVEVYGPNSEKEVEQHRFSPMAAPPLSQLGLLPVAKPQATCSQNAALGSPPGVQRKDQIPASPAATPAPAPKTSVNSLLNPEYVQDARSYIAESLPVQCRTPYCLDKMAGQHVQQLLATAKLITTVQESYLQEGVLEMLGLFIVNEYIYFSRLDIKKKFTYVLGVEAFKVPILDQINSIKSKNKKAIKAFRKLNEPSVSYSNFRLDLTIARHRLALMVFLKKYTQAFHQLKM